MAPPTGGCPGSTQSPPRKGTPTEAVLPIAIGIAVVLFVFAWAAKPEAQQACRKLWNTSYNTIINPNSDFPEHAIPFAFDDDQCQLLVHCEPNRLC